MTQSINLHDVVSFEICPVHQTRNDKGCPDFDSRKIMVRTRDGSSVEICLYSAPGEGGLK